MASKPGSRNMLTLIPGENEKGLWRAWDDWPSYCGIALSGRSASTNEGAHSGEFKRIDFRERTGYLRTVIRRGTIDESLA